MENLKLTAVNLFALGQAVVEAKQNDGQLTFADIGIIGTPALGFLTSISDFELLKDEWDNSDKTQRQELKEYIKGRFDLEDDGLEQVIEDGMDVVFSLIEFYESSLKLREKAA